jgi:hypothetical protein
MEMRNGENPSLTSFVGASALPSHTAAASPQKTPSRCREMVDREPAAVAPELKRHLRAINRTIPRINTTTGTQR